MLAQGTIRSFAVDNDPPENQHLPLVQQHADGTTTRRPMEDLIRVPCDHVGIALLVIGHLGDEFDSLESNDVKIWSAIQRIANVIKPLEEKLLIAIEESLRARNQSGSIDILDPLLKKAVAQIRDEKAICLTVDLLNSVFGRGGKTPASLACFSVCAIQMAQWHEVRVCFDTIDGLAEEDPSVDWRTLSRDAHKELRRVTHGENF